MTFLPATTLVVFIEPAIIVVSARVTRADNFQAGGLFVRLR
jgi:hypothetical protein